MWGKKGSCDIQWEKKHLWHIVRKNFCTVPKSWEPMGRSLVSPGKISIVLKIMGVNEQKHSGPTKNLNALFSLVDLRYIGTHFLFYLWSACFFLQLMFVLFLSCIVHICLLRAIAHSWECYSFLWSNARFLFLPWVWAIILWGIMKKTGIDRWMTKFTPYLTNRQKKHQNTFATYCIPSRGMQKMARGKQFTLDSEAEVDGSVVMRRVRAVLGEWGIWFFERIR